jgi:hypothetical protein
MCLVAAISQAKENRCRVAGLYLGNDVALK